MARGKSSLPPPKEPLRLLVHRSEAQQRITQQVDKGEKISALQVRNPADLESARAERAKWTDDTEELLGRLFTGGSLVEEFKYAGLGGIRMGPVSFGDQVRSFREGVKAKVTRLESVIERLELFPEPSQVEATAPFLEERPEKKSGRSPGNAREVFVVHGHDEGARAAVWGLLTKLRLQPIVLHEQANKGRTVIEKFEAHSDVAFAIVIMTGDDLGAAKISAKNVQARARQNVVFELGYFLAKLAGATVTERRSARARRCP